MVYWERINFFHMLNLPKGAKRVFKGIRCEIYHWEQELYDGTTATFEKIYRPHSATIFAVSDNRILIQEQEQPHRDEAFLCLPGGWVEEEEDIHDGAKRELLEETGYASDDWELWTVAGARGYVHWENNIFIARDCRKVSELKLDAGEKIENRTVSFDEFWELLDNPSFRHKDILSQLLEIRDDPEKKEEFRKLLGIK